MKISDNFTMIDNFTCPAFTVNNGIVDWVNESAEQRGVVSGAAIDTLIETGAAEYSAFTGGILCLTLLISGNRYAATVGTLDDRQIFCLESDYEEPELRAFALAAQELRAPLANALSQTAQILPDHQNSESTAKLNKSLHQLLRAVCNMSDAALYTNPNCANMQLQDTHWFFSDILEKAKDFAQRSGRILEYDLPTSITSCLMDKEKVERAIYNLISNAIKFSSENSVIHICVEKRNDRLYFKVKNESFQNSPYLTSSFFKRFIREPGLEDPRNGIGLGMSIVRSVALLHNGTLLLENRDDFIYVTMTMDASIPKKMPLHSPIMLPIDYTGGYDHASVEMADVLSDSLFTE